MHGHWYMHFSHTVYFSGFLIYKVGPLQSTFGYGIDLDVLESKIYGNKAGSDAVRLVLVKFKTDSQTKQLPHFWQDLMSASPNDAICYILDWKLFANAAGRLRCVSVAITAC